MTPVEERIDHAARTLELIGELSHTHGLVNPMDRECSSEKRCLRCLLERSLDALLTEDPAREELLTRFQRFLAHIDPDGREQQRFERALPATESAQPEEDRTEAWIHSPERESPAVEAEGTVEVEDMGADPGVR